MTLRAAAALAALGALPALPALTGCVEDGRPLEDVSTFQVRILSLNGEPLPTADAPRDANLGDTEDVWEVEISARAPTGEPAEFDGMVRLSVNPGAVVGVEGDGAAGRNLLVIGGQARGMVRVTAVYGPTRLWVEDLGYVPAPPDVQAACANGENDDPNEDVLVDYPADPGCAYANDSTEEGGAFAAGVSPPVEYALPRISDIQGGSAQTPYPYEGMEVKTSSPQRVVVTRVASDGFYVTDLAEQSEGYNSLFAFNFSTPPGMRVCDRVSFLSGTISEFFGFTELSFPSYRLDYVFEGEPCEVPEPTLLDASIIADPIKMEKLESALARLTGFHIAANFGKDKPEYYRNSKGNYIFTFKPGASSCDLNDDGQVDFEAADEGTCGNACSDDPECSEWTGYSARGNYKVTSETGTVMMQINTNTVGGFDPTSHRGEVLDAVTGTLRNFSGGSLNWTLETRCSDDLVCMATGCEAAIKPSSEACVRLRSQNDNEAQD